MLMSDAVLASDRTLPTGAGRWLSVLRRYLLFVAGANLVWETLHLPLYTIWQDGTVEELAFAAVHSSGGDVLIARSALVLRTEERRVGNEGVSTCRSRGSPDHVKKNG